jgi:hypothetical protein
MSRIDREMFNLIEQLAQPEHRDLFESLPAQVREEQRARATSIVTTILHRWLTTND